MAEATALLAEKISVVTTNPIAGKCSDTSNEMKKSILLLAAFIGICLAAVSCRNRNEVSYEIPSAASATGSGGNGVKAKPGTTPSVFGPGENPGR